MSLFGFLSDWGKSASRINDSDKIIESLIGTNPKSYHPDIYKTIIRETLDYERVELSGTPMTLAEFSAFRIGLFSQIAENAEDYKMVQTCADALGRVCRSCANEIGWKVNLQLAEFSRNLSYQDSFEKNRK